VRRHRLLARQGRSKRIGRNYLSLKIGGVLGSAARLHVLAGRTSVVAPQQFRAIHVLWRFLAVAYLAHVSVLPLKRGKRLAMPGAK